MRTDPTDTGGLISGRRPGTAPVRYREQPERAGTRRQRTDGALALAIAALMVLINLLFWGPIPAAGLWVGSQASYHSDNNLFLGITVAFFVILAAIMVGLMVLQAPRRGVGARAPRGGLRPAPGHHRADLRRVRRDRGDAVHDLAALHRWPRGVAGAQRLTAGGAPRLLQAVSGPLGGGRQHGAARAGDRAPPAGADEGRPDRPLADDVARAAPTLRGERRHLRRPAGAAPLPRSPRERAARRAVARVRSPTDAARRRQRRGPAARRGGAGAPRARRRARHPVAVLSALPADGPARPGPRRARAGLGGPRRSSGRSTTARGSSRSATRTTRRASGWAPSISGRCCRRCPTGSPCCSTRRSSTSSAPGRTSPRSTCSRTSRGSSSFARSRRRGAWRACASATRSAAPTPSRSSSASSPSSARTSSPRPGRWRRCATCRASSSAASRR